jgi:serine/threonine-protein kinase RsbT
MTSTDQPREASRCKTASVAVLSAAANAQVPINSDEDIILARQKGRALATGIGFASGDATLIATAISELARNIVSYARKGQIILRMVNDSNRGGISVIASDDGPGIPDIRQALQAGFSTSGSLGLGLPGVRHFMDEFEITSQPGRGTTVAVKKWDGQLQGLSPRETSNRRHQVVPNNAPL